MAAVACILAVVVDTAGWDIVVAAGCADNPVAVAGSGTAVGILVAMAGSGTAVGSPVMAG